MKKLLLIIAVILVAAMLPGTALADEGYDIISHDIHITVSEDNVLDVVERLTLNFKQERHGLFYNLQYSGKQYYDIDGEWNESKYKYDIYDFNVYGHKFELSNENMYDGKYLRAKIGDPDKTVTGQQEYIITYKCNVGDDGFDQFDEFYRNIINCYVEDTIESASFIIELPKEFDQDKVNVTIGQYGSYNNEDVYWETDGSAIKGHILRPMTGGEILTVRAELPDGYFVGVKNPDVAWNTASLIISGLMILTALVLWLIFGKDTKIYPTVEFYAPDGMTPAEAGYIIDGCVDNKDIVSLIMYWADKGYLKIVEQKKGKFELIKVKKLEPNAKRFERIMFDELFKRRKSVELEDLKQSFYTTMETTKASVSSYFEGTKNRKVFTAASVRAQNIMGLLTMIPIVFTIFMYIYRDGTELWMSVIYTLLAGWLISLPVFVLANVFKQWRSSSSGKRIGKLLFAVILLTVVFVVYNVLIPEMFNATDTLLVTGTTTIITIIMAILMVIMRKRTKQGDQWLGKLIGFKRFIEKAEKDRIRLLVEENPSYFYNVLPYAYVLGVTDKWAKNFEGIGVQPPTWYTGYHGMRAFNTMMFTSMMMRNMSSFQTTMTSRPPSSGGGAGGFSGGGGFAGGGGGGGGAGGSW